MNHLSGERVSHHNSGHYKVAHSVWTGGSCYTGRTALPHKNIQLMFLISVHSFNNGSALNPK